MDYLIHTANVLYIFSYLVRDILWLRILIVVAICFVIPFYYFQPVPLMAPVYWNLVFAGINIVQISILLVERRPVTLSDAEQRLYQQVFRRLTPREVYRLFSLAQWNQARAGDTLVQQDMQLDSLMLINRGEATVQVKNDKVAKLGEGHFVGEMSYITGDKTSATVIADSDLEYVTWPTSTLEPLLIKYPDLRIALNAIIGVDLAGKLSRI
jgi:hypothetical protein